MAACAYKWHLVGDSVSEIQLRCRPAPEMSPTETRTPATVLRQPLQPCRCAAQLLSASVLPNHYHGLHNRKNASTALTGYPSQALAMAWLHTLHISSAYSAPTSSKIQLRALARADAVGVAIMEMSRLRMGCRPQAEFGS